MPSYKFALWYFAVRSDLAEWAYLFSLHSYGSRPTKLLELAARLEEFISNKRESIGTLFSEHSWYWCQWNEVCTLVCIAQLLGMAPRSDQLICTCVRFSTQLISFLPNEVDTREGWLDSFHYKKCLIAGLVETMASVDSSAIDSLLSDGESGTAVRTAFSAYS